VIDNKYNEIIEHLREAKVDLGGDLCQIICDDEEEELEEDMEDLYEDE